MEEFRRAVTLVMGRAAGNDDQQQLDRSLMASVQKQLTEVASAVAAIRPLAELPESEKRECAKTASVRRYPAKTVVYDDDRDSIDADAHFVLDGQCTCVQRLDVLKTVAFGHDRYKLVRERRDVGIPSGWDLHTVYVKMSDLHPGSVFGLGEKRPGRLVLATTDVKCLLVPLAFLTKHNVSNVWGRTVCSMNGSDPTVEQSFRKYVMENRWEEYRKSIVADTLRKLDPSSRRW